jgi:hypothetical protein
MDNVRDQLLLQAHLKAVATQSIREARTYNNLYRNQTKPTEYAELKSKIGIALLENKSGF